MDYNLWQELILNTTKPFRVGANVLGQNWGSALTGKDMSQSQNQGQFLKWLAGGITPEEQTAINEKPYLEAIKSSAGMASTLAPFATQSLRTAQLATNPVTNKFAQLLSQGALEGGLGGFGYSRDGKEVQDTLTGVGLGAAGEVAFEALRNPSFRRMIGEAGTYVDPKTGQRMYKGALGSEPEMYSHVNLTDEAYERANELAEKWGDIGSKDITSVLDKLGKGGDRALNAEAEWIGQAWDTLDDDAKILGWRRLQEIMDTMKDPGQRSQVVFLRKYLTPPENIIQLDYGATPRIGANVPETPSATLRDYETGNLKEILLDSDAVKYPKGKPDVEGALGSLKSTYSDILDNKLTMKDSSLIEEVMKYKSLEDLMDTLKESVPPEQLRKLVSLWRQIRG